MLVTTVDHGKAVFGQWDRGRDWIVIDTEDEPKFPWKNKSDIITYGRQRITIFSICYKGESYSFPTSDFSLKYPTRYKWWTLLKPIFLNPEIIKVFHNANFDLSVFDTSVQEIFDLRMEWDEWPDFWCTNIGCWIANPAVPKALKARAALYGRFLQESKNVDPTNLQSVAQYAEQDAVATDELFQMQRYGVIERSDFIAYLVRKNVVGGLYKDVVRNPMPKIGDIKIRDEDLDDFELKWMNWIELPVLRSTMRAEKFGFPMDLKYLKRIHKDMKNDLQGLLRDIYQTAGKKINLGSKNDLTWLFKKLKIRNVHKTPKGQMAAGKNILARLINEHPIIQKLANRKKINTLLNFYFGGKDKKGNEKSQGLSYYTNPDTGRIHAMMDTTGAVTGRNTCKNPNLHQVPARADIYGIKRAFVAPGYETAVKNDNADSSD